MMLFDLAAGLAAAALVCGIIILLARKPWQSYRLPDQAFPLGRVVDDGQIAKLHRKVPGDPERVHHFRKDVREIVNRESEHGRSLLPAVKSEEELQDNSSKWYFSLKQGGREVLRNATPLRPKQRIPARAINALETSVNELLEKCRRGSSVARQFADTFHLPDPTRVSHFYRIFGPPWKRELTVLWGFNPDRTGTNYTIPAEAAMAALRKRTVPNWWPGVTQLLLLPLIFIGITLGVMKVLPERRAAAAEQATSALLAETTAKLPGWKALVDRLAALASRQASQATLLTAKSEEAARTEAEVKEAKTKPEASLANYPVYLKSYKDQSKQLDGTFDEESKEFESLQKEINEATAYVEKEVRPRAAISARWAELAKAADETMARLDSSKKAISQAFAAWSPKNSIFKLHIEAIEKLLGDTTNNTAAFNTFAGNYRLLAEQLVQGLNADAFGKKLDLTPKDLVKLFVTEATDKPNSSDFRVMFARAMLVKLREKQTETGAIGELLSSAKRLRLNATLPADLPAILGDPATCSKAIEIFNGQYRLAVTNAKGESTLGIDLPSFLALLERPLR